MLYSILERGALYSILPLRIQDCLDSVAWATMFSTLDLTAGYHQVRVKAEDIPKTAFVTKYGHFEYKTMPFWLTNAPGTFQRVMEMALNGLQGDIYLIYLDDIVIISRTFEEHISRLSQVVPRIEEAGLKLKPEKCNLFQDEVVFLGHRVTKEETRFLEKAPSLIPRGDEIGNFRERHRHCQFSSSFWDVFVIFHPQQWHKEQLASFLLLMTSDIIKWTRLI